jgi:hypothetical protein
LGIVKEERTFGIITNRLQCFADNLYITVLGLNIYFN